MRDLLVILSRRSAAKDPLLANRGGGPSLRSGASRLRRLRMTTILVALALILAATVASACPVCYGNQQTPLNKSASNGILFLLGIVGSVQIGFVALFVSFWKRTKALQQKREQFQIIEGGKE